MRAPSASALPKSSFPVNEIEGSCCFRRFPCSAGAFSLPAGGRARHFHRLFLLRCHSQIRLRLQLKGPPRPKTGPPVDGQSSTGDQLVEPADEATK